MKTTTLETPASNREISAWTGAMLATWVALLIAAPASSTTFKMVSDENLVSQADLVVEGSVLTAYAVDSRPFPSTEYVVLPSRSLKGETEGSTLIVRVVGGLSPSGRRFEVAGAPRLEEGSEVFLFLKQNRDGSYGLLHLGMGAFERIDQAGERIAVRQIDGSLEASDRGRRLRDYDRFVGWVDGTVRGERPAADYYFDRDGGHEFVAAYTLEEYEDLNVRWFDFDGGKTVDWKIAGSDSPVAADALRAAITAWNSVPGPHVQMAYAGSGASTSGFQTADGQNTVLFGDPNDLIGGKFECSKGGIMALGGWWSDEVTGRFEGKEFYRIIEGDIVVNDGVECYLDQDPKRMESMFAHELGHALGLGHSCGDQASGACDTQVKKEAIMNAYAENDVRGASLKRDDMEALAALYGDLVVEELPAPTGLKAKLMAGDQKVKLTWTDNSDSEDAFEIFRKVGNSPWELWKTVNGDHSRLKSKVEVDGSGKVIYRARAIASISESPFSNAAKVRLR
jgi:Matrixin